MISEPSTISVVSPVAQQERISMLDSLRGIAILGILLMNIPGFALPQNQASDPSVLNETGLNFKTWYFIELVLTGTQRAFFSMLFGAGIILFLSRLEKKVPGYMAAEYFFRRQLWLLVFGLFNAYVLLWFWDILFAYAICGMILFAFRRLSPKALLIGALVSLLFMTLRENRDLYLDKETIAKGERISRIDTTSIKLTDQQKEDLDAMLAFKEKASHEGKVKASAKEVRNIQGRYDRLYAYQSEKSLHVELYYTFFLIWDILLFMFLGMAFFKNGILIGKASNKIYWIMCIGGLTLGFALTYLHLQPIIETSFDEYNYSKRVFVEYFQLSRMLRSIGFFGLVMLLYKSGWFKWLFALLRPVGQMAFTNYLMQSLMCGLSFYGIGFGMFGKLQRYEIYYVVGAVWIIEIIWSHIWLRHFRFGSLEWLWRSLTYWKKQPMKYSEQVKESKQTPEPVS